MIELNELETARFGICAGTLIDNSARPDEIESAARRMGVQMLTTRIDVGTLSQVHDFERAGYQLMDTLIYYRQPAVAFTSARIDHAEVRLRMADPSDAHEVAKVAQRSFMGYIGHYHADPRLDRGAADAAYVEWAETSTINVSYNTPVLVGEVDTKIVCFLTMRRNSVSENEVVLNAVDPEYQGRGLYSALLRKSLSHSAEVGASQVITSTQINNYAVQRVWCRHGFSPYRGIYTFHKWFD